MKPYGQPGKPYYDCDSGPPSRYAKVRSKRRHESRRLDSKAARNAAKVDLSNRIKN